MTEGVGQSPEPKRGGGMAAVLGALAFLAGAGALVWVFLAALHLYEIPADELVRAGSGSEPDLAQLAQSATATLVRVLLLVVMAVAAALLASAGARFYLGSRRPD